MEPEYAPPITDGGRREVCSCAQLWLGVRVTYGVRVGGCNRTKSPVCRVHVLPIDIVGSRHHKSTPPDRRITSTHIVESGHEDENRKTGG